MAAKEPITTALRNGSSTEHIIFVYLQYIDIICLYISKIVDPYILTTQGKILTAVVGRLRTTDIGENQNAGFKQDIWNGLRMDG